MSTINLMILANKREELIKAEIIALLHNLAKMHGDFLIKVADPGERRKYENANPGFDYNDQRIEDASVVINFKTYREKIQGEKDRRKLACEILQDDSLWGEHLTVAKGLMGSWNDSIRTWNNPSQPDPPSQNFKTIAKQLAKSVGDLDKGVTEIIIRDSKGALALADLMQSSGIDKYLDHGSFKAWLRKTTLEVLSEKQSLSSILLLYWDDFHWQTGSPENQMRDSSIERWVNHPTRVPRYLATAHAIVSRAEKDIPKKRGPQAYSLIWRSTMFGYEVTGKTICPASMDEARNTLLNTLVSADLAQNHWREQIVEESDTHLGLALGETARPLNEITLWDFATAIGTLFKASIAKALLEGRFVETSELKWRLLSIRYDGLEYLSRALHISDLLARRKALDAALNAVKAVIEVEYPLGNEIYRDENGSVLVVPHIEDADPEFSLLNAPCDDEGTLGELLTMRFATQEYAEGKKALEGEVKPLVDLSDASLGKDITLSKAKGWKNPPLQPDPLKVVEWWNESVNHADVCTVCGLRPQNYGAPDVFQKRRAQDRSTCWVCMERRDDQSKGWAQAAMEDFQRTIWVDEVADNNGRIALVVGRFVMDRWLDGSLIPTMQKSASFARIQRCWRTTEIFWKEIENTLPQILGNGFRGRLLLKPRDVHDLNLRGYNTYELEIFGRHLSVVWDASRACLISCENVAALGNLSGLRKALVGMGVGVFEPSAHLSPRERVKTIVVDEIESVGKHGDEESSSPFIPILASPAMFMALVPADKALSVIEAVRLKHETEMAKVRDRLAIHTGIVFAPRRTPIRALLEAGRRMLKMPDGWETWKVKEVNPTGLEKDPPDDLNISFDNGVSWKVPLRMGDGTTVDEWYPHFVKDRQYFDVDDAKKIDHMMYARKLQVGDEVLVCPSRFDFEYLDVAGRRNEISYVVDEHSKIFARRGIPTRPLLFEDFPRLNKLWDWMTQGEKKLTTSQLQHLEAALVSYIGDWFNGDILKASQCQTFVSFSQAVLRRADPAWWKSQSTETTETRDAFNKAVSTGLLLDVLELHLHILRERPKEEAIATQPGENL